VTFGGPGGGIAMTFGGPGRRNSCDLHLPLGKFRLPQDCRFHVSPAEAEKASEVISANSCDIAVFEMGENERGAGDVTDLAGAGCDVPEGAPAPGEQGESAFAQAA
jgi:hypothetical protein